MRSASASMIAFLNANTLAEAWHLVTIVPRSGATNRWTDCGTSLALTRPARPVDTEANGSYTFTAHGTGTVPVLTEVGGHRDAVGLEIEQKQIRLGCGEGAQWNGVRLPLAALAGTLDGARVKVERVFGAAGSAGPDMTLGAIHVFEGNVAEVVPSSTAVEITVESGIADLRDPLPKKLLSPGCSNMLFDAQCDPGGTLKTAKTVTGTVSAATPIYVVTGLTQADGYFDLGVITFTSGANNGVSRTVRSYLNTAGQVYFDRLLSVAPSIGDTFSITPGCDKRKATCDTKFSNLTHLRAFPYVPRREVA